MIVQRETVFFRSIHPPLHMTSGYLMKIERTWFTNFLLLLAALPVIASAQTVPVLVADSVDEELPPVPFISTDRVRLDGKEIHGARLAEEWKTHPDRPRTGADGRVYYLYGATLPTLVCTPMQVCSIQLQTGEVVNDVHAGDTARWRITPASSGNGATATTHVIVKPTDAGLVTNLFITTDRRSYVIKLVSTQQDWIPVLAFDYPDDVQRAWAEHQEHQSRHLTATTLATGENLAALNFNFTIKGGKSRTRPQRVYTDGHKTYIQFASANFGDRAPALVALGHGDQEELINYRVIGDRYVVDQVIDRVALISGVGRKQNRVVIERRR